MQQDERLAVEGFQRDRLLAPERVAVGAEHVEGIVQQRLEGDRVARHVGARDAQVALARFEALADAAHVVVVHHHGEVRVLLAHPGEHWGQQAEDR